MTREDSPIRDFYPTKLQFDPNGKKFAWQWVVLLPFIDEARLVQAMKSIWVRLFACLAVACLCMWLLGLLFGDAVGRFSNACGFVFVVVWPRRPR